MKMVYTNESIFLANNAKNLIEAQGIKSFIKNEFSQGAVGEVSAFDVWPEIWVFDDADEKPALEILQSENNVKGEDWVCKNCAEENDASFEICWSCQSVNVVAQT